jgi:hypothetical protein
MANRLRALKVDFVSMVPRPANQNATFVLAKHDPEPEPYWKRDFSDAERKKLADSGAAEPDGSYPIANTSDLSNAIHAYGRSSNPAKTKAHIITRARALGATSMLPADWTVGKTDDPKETRTVPKLEVQTKAAPTPATDSNPDPDHDGDDDRTASGDTDHSHFNADGSKKTMKSAEVETISKAEFTKLQDQNAKILKALEASEERALKAEAVAKAEQDARELHTAIAKAEKELPALPGATSTEVGTLLRDVSKAVTPEVYGRLETILLAANAAVAKGDLFKEHGSTGSTANGGATAMDQIQAVAKGLIEKDPSLTPAKSVSKAMELRPDLVQADRRERGFARD